MDYMDRKVITMMVIDTVTLKVQNLNICMTFCVLMTSTLHTEARFVPDSPLPKLPFWLLFAPLRQFLKAYKNISVHVSL